MKETVVELAMIALKAAVIVAAVLQLASINIWFERKVSALIQNRVGANRAKILGLDLAGLINTLIADPIKALAKEDFVPRGTSTFMHGVAPFLAVFPVLLCFAVVPFGPALKLGNREVTLQLADFNAGLLFVFATGSLAVYGTVLAGWVSNNKFALLGALRGAAQMISYEITMGISLVGLLAVYGTLDLNQIVAQQTGTVSGVLPRWGIFLSPFNWIAFIIFFASVMAETKRLPFDLSESESELVAGYLTEYSGMKFLLFWLGEFAEIVVAAVLVVILFFGGWQAPYFDITGLPWAPLLGAGIFGCKVLVFCLLQIVIRWSLPRFRYDQLINLCWKIMLPAALANGAATIMFELALKS